MPVKPGYLLVKPIYVYLGVVEKILYSGYEPLYKPIIPGSSGVVRVLEDPSNKYGELSGKLAIVSHIGKYGVLGLDEDGLLSNYSSIHPSYIYGYVEEAKPVHAIYPHIAYSISLGRETSGLTVILGCNLPEIITAYYIKKYKDEEPVILCSNIPRYLKVGKLKFYRHVSNLPSSCNTIVVGYDKYSLIHEALSRVSAEKIIVSIYSRLNILPVKRGVNTHLLYIDSVDGIEHEILDDIGKYIIRKYLKIVKAEDIGEIPGLLPPRRMGVVVELR